MNLPIPTTSSQAARVKRQAAQLLCVFAFISAPIFTAHADDANVTFNRDVRPILSGKCFQCHGPDQDALEADLRLDSFETATALRPGHDLPAIVPGDAKASPLLARVSTHDADDLMPPPATKKPVTADEIDTLRQWIEQGAKYENHWAFLPIQNTAPPTISDPDKAKNPIDLFIRSEQAKKNITPAPEADAHTLVRRLHLDLTGLLPDANTVDQFVALHKMDADTAVSVMTDRLLNSPHHAERWARHWLDQARYADSNGYTIDGERSMWPYRDWVIRAIGDDMPFDQFTVEQLAGDLLPNPTKSQLVATGFHRNTLINQEGGTDDEQFRDEEVTDRVNTTGAVWLGLTLGCSQCHTHKFDPLTHQEYYEMFAFFNSTEDINNVGPTVEIAEGEMFLFDSNPDLTKKLDTSRAKLATLDASVAKAKRQTEWEKQQVDLIANQSRQSASWSALEAVSMNATGGAPLTLQSDGSILAGTGGKNESYEISYRPPVAAEGNALSDTDKTTVAAVRLRVIPDNSLPNKGPGLAGNGNFVLTEFEIWQGDAQLAVARVQADHSQPGHEVGRLIDADAQTGWAINIGTGTPSGVKMNAPHEAHFILSEPAKLRSGENFRIVLRHGSNANSNYNIGRFAVDSSPTLPASIDQASAVNDALLTASDKRNDDQKKLLTTAFAAADSTRSAAATELANLKRQLGYGPSAKVMITRQLKKNRDTFLHQRGSFLDLDRELGLLSPGVPAILPDLLPADAKDNNPATRLDLAHWLMRDDNPLTARVTVNRVWMRYFGRGLVETENDFGTQGSFPTHPELLDWLARRFIEDGWSMRKLHKLIVTSATYRQSSHARPELNDIDPLNHLLARQNRIRFDAEIVRDAALSASGLLSAKIGGRSVNPPQPDGIYAFTQRKPIWSTDTGPDRYRRAMYTQFYRSAPYPLLSTFDAPDFQSVCTSRPRSNTPLQSLTLANSDALFELAQGLGKRLYEMEQDNPATRITAAYQWCYARPPSDSELTSVHTFFKNQSAHFQSNPDAAKKIAVTPAAAAWTTVARALMNTDEFITRE